MRFLQHCCRVRKNSVLLKAWKLILEIGFQAFTISPAWELSLSRIIRRMAEYLDLNNWARREAFEFFRGFDKPYFNLCTMLDVSRLLATLKPRSDVDASEAKPQRASVSLAYHYLVLRAANEIEPFRYRLRDGKVLVHPVIHGATTVFLPNETFNFAYFNYEQDFVKFVEGAKAAVAAATAAGNFQRKDNDDNMIHCTVLPWVAFTSFSHARNWKREDSVPKISFGKFVRDGERTLLPFSVEVHHALMDGFHVGRYIMRVEEFLAEPERYVAGPDAHLRFKSIGLHPRV